MSCLNTTKTYYLKALVPSKQVIDIVVDCFHVVSLRYGISASKSAYRCHYSCAANELLYYPNPSVALMHDQG